MVFVYLLVAVLVSWGIVAENLILMTIGIAIASLALAARRRWKPAGISILVALAILAAELTAEQSSIGSFGDAEAAVIGSVVLLAVLVVGFITMIGVGPVAKISKRSSGGGHE